MQLIGRRNFVAGLGLGAAGTLLGGLSGRLIGEARGQGTVHRRIVWITQGNAWDHGGGTGSATGATNTGMKSGMFRAAYRSPVDFDLPSFMAGAFAPYKSEVAIWFGLTNHNTNPANHGPGNHVLTAQPEKVDGISIDRAIGAELRRRYQDVHQGPIVGPVLASYGGKNCGAPSYDAPGRPADSYMTPVKAYAAYFGGPAGMTPQQAQANLELERSLFDGMRDDLARARRRLAGPETAKLDQLTTSLREYEAKLAALQTGPRLMTGKPPAPTVDKSGMDKDIIRALLDLTVQVQSFGLTHNSHFSMHGAAAFDDDNWKPLAGPTFNNYGQNHNGLFHTENDTARESVRMMNRYMAGEIAWVRAQLGNVKLGSGTLADETVIAWITQGGLRHHNGSPAQAFVFLAGSKTKLKAPYWNDYLTSGSGFELKGTRHAGQAFVSLANAMDVQMTTFGSATGALPDVLKS